MKNISKRVPYLVTLLWLLFFLFPDSVIAQQGKLIPTNSSQKNFLKAYRLILEAADDDYRSTGSSMDKSLFPDYGEFSVYWITSGENAGSFIYPDELPVEYEYVTANDYINYNWQALTHISVQYKRDSGTVAIFKSKRLVT